MDGQDDRLIAGREPGDTRSGAAPAGASLLLGATLACTLAALPLLAAPLAPDALPVLAAACLAGALLLAAAGFAAGLLLAHARAGRARVPAWPQPALAIGAGSLAAAVILAAWHTPGDPSPGVLLAAGGAMLVLAFPVLVLERFCAASPDAALAGAAGLTALLRAVLLVQLGLGLALLLWDGGFAATTPLIHVAGVLVLLLAAEFVLRGVAALFQPAPPPSTARPAARSLLAAAISLHPYRLASVNQTVTRQLGIDLSRSWALSFAGRALAPVGLALTLLAWGLTGLVSLPLDQRAVYQRFGRPVEVLGPGLHLRLPWPFGVTKRLDQGVLRELTLIGPAPGGDPAMVLPGAEDPPPQAADRLWDRPHPGEATYLIASPAASGQGFQRVDVDLRLIIRTGLSDAAALQAAYDIADPDALVRATAGRLLARYFASRTLAGVLGEDRATFTETIRIGLQQELDRLGVGTEIVAVVVEAIHPPPAAADAWHNVQAAEIRARVAVAAETGAAAKAIAGARTTAALAADTATAVAAEMVARAEADHTLFGADRDAYAAAPNAFQLERWFTRLRAALSRAQLLVIDHRLSGAQTPTLDLRALAPAAATPP
jgi:regulator of protease activity HflC (stomatin/prohibitin superfamily)